MNGDGRRILTALSGGKPDVTPVAIDYMSLYLAERTESAYVDAYRDRLERVGRIRLDPDEDVNIRASAILRAYECFQERHDWLQVFGGPPAEVLLQRELVLEDGTVFEIDGASGTRRQMLLSGQEAKNAEMRYRFEKAHRPGLQPDQLKQILAERRAQARAARGDLRVVRAVVRQQSQKCFFYTGASAPFWALYDLFGFEGMMMALNDTPDLVFSVMDDALQATLEYAQAFRDAGGHGIRVEECLASADMISPVAYERYVYPYEERLFAQLRRMGLKTILYFCGDVMPRLPALRQLPVDALMVEESKKTFTIDIAEVRRAVGPDLCLLGNIDSYTVVQKGSEEEMRAEVARQVQTAGVQAAFIVGVGSPLPLDTPPERVDLFIRHARSCLPGGLRRN